MNLPASILGHCICTRRSRQAHCISVDFSPVRAFLIHVCNPDLITCKLFPYDPSHTTLTPISPFNNVSPKTNPSHFIPCQSSHAFSGTKTRGSASDSRGPGLTKSWLCVPMPPSLVSEKGPRKSISTSTTAFQEGGFEHKVSSGSTLLR